MSNEPNSIIRSIINASAWSFIGILLTVIFFYWQEYRNPFDFKIELVDQFNLVEVKENISDLKILYKNDDLLSSGKIIKVVRFNIKNTGDTLLQSYYDQLEPFGLRFMKSKVLNAEVIESNSDNLFEQLISKNQSLPNSEYSDLIFSKLIFDEGDSISIKVTLLQESQDSLVVTPLGKLANIKAITISSPTAETEKKIPTWAYFAGGYFGLAVFMIISILIISYSETRSRKKKLNQYINDHGALRDTEAEIGKLYLEVSDRTLGLISALLEDDYVLDLSSLANKQPEITARLSFASFSFKTPRTLIYKLPKSIFHTDGTKVTFNSENQDFLKSFFGEVLEEQ